MAENEDGAEKTEEPSQKKLQEARDKGQIPRSRELTTVLMTLSAALFLYVFGGTLLSNFSELVTQGLSFDRNVAFDTQKLFDQILSIVIGAIWLALPFMLLMAFIAIVSPMLLGGWAFSAQAMAPSFSKLNPISGLKRMFSAKALLELFKALAKFSLVIAMATFFLYVVFAELLNLGIEPLHYALGHSGELIIEAFIFVSLSLLIVAAIDVPFQLWDHNRQLKMTKQEVKEEFKQQEGSPEVKGRIRQVQREMAQRRMMQKVPEADVVITNPTHFAVALKYDPETMGEPLVLAMGVDFMAAQIRTIASEHQIQIVEAPPLARALYYNAELDRPIPYDLFKAVAAILAYVFQLEEGGRARAMDFSDLPIPENMKTE
ncbi:MULTISPECIES: flagellar biosynthesis protein FlhB [Thiomicrorhabdus]|uniref:Flagellar biosynthetic protein FlhB n=1 Tax=Thiomicrorhabdus heinhorstiae TaxID=2748010 RepID=A0ABS0BX35_9GAMM|nr:MULTISPECIES: flagellar biosynthesis protein FlhB [Thiomicrorhabdus]MBF6058365.1 flagellar biosynthesis protein FlhB [Thiomicrorhabdus heinhorstiae]